MKRILAFFLAALMILSLAACAKQDAGVKEEPTAAPETAEAADKTEAAAETADADGYVAATKTTLKISNGTADSHPMIQTLQTFKTDLEAALPGRFNVEIYPNATLGDDSSATQDCSMGTLESVLTPASVITSIVPELQIFDLPFLVPNTEAADALGAFMNDYLQEAFKGTGLKMVGFLELGWRSVTNSKREIIAPADAKGLKIRIMDNPMHLALWNTVEAAPVTMAWSELFTALQQGTVDGQENPVATIYSANFQEVQDYITMTEHIYAPYLFLVNEELWDSLTEYEQEKFMECAKAYETAEKDAIRAANDANVADLEAAGMKVTTLTSEQKQAWVDACQPVYDKFKDQIGADFVDEVVELMNQYR